MRSRRRRAGRPVPLRALMVSAAILVSAPGAAVRAQQDDDAGTNHLGRVHDRIRDAKERQAVSLEQSFNEIGVRYTQAKKQIEAATGLSYSVDVTVTSQWGVPGGGDGAVQALFMPALNWKAFDSPGIGAGSFQFYYVASQYWSPSNASALQGRLKLNSPVNDYPASDLFFAQASYTHEFPGKRVSVTLGQYPFANFDGNAYANNQQVNFIGYSLAQNGSQNYSQGSLGAYAQVNPVKDVALAGGFQDASNLTGASIQFGTLGAGRYAWFLYGGWSPKVAGLGRGHYGLMYYNLPSVPAQPLASDGLSFSASQSLGGRWAAFLRANTAWNSSWYIQSSVAGGTVLKDPLRRNPLDQIGLGMAWNRTNTGLYGGSFARQSETMLEAYWATTIGSRLQVTPDFQLYLQPALTPSQQVAAVFTLRVGVLF